MTLIANKAYPTGEGLQYIVEFHDGNQVKQTEASLFNPYTLLLQNPGKPISKCFITRLVILKFRLRFPFTRTSVWYS